MKTCIYCGSEEINGRMQCGARDTPTMGCLLISKLREEISRLEQSVQRMQYSLNLIGEPYQVGECNDSNDTSNSGIYYSSGNYIKF
mgnify:CR=1 FL=1